METIVPVHVMMMSLVYQSKVVIPAKYDFTNYHSYFQNVKKRGNTVENDGSAPMVAAFTITEIHHLWQRYFLLLSATK